MTEKQFYDNDENMACTLIHGDCLAEMDKLIRGGRKWI